MTRPMCESLGCTCNITDDALLHLAADIIERTPGFDTRHLAARLRELAGREVAEDSAADGWHAPDPRDLTTDTWRLGLRNVQPRPRRRYPPAGLPQRPTPRP